MQLDEGQRLNPERVKHEGDVMDKIDRSITWHVCPVMMLGHSRTNLAAKFRVFLHTLGLLVGSRSELKELAESIVSIHTDYGTEVGISRVLPCSISDALPYMHVDTPCQPETPIRDQDNFFLDDMHVQDDDMFVTDLSEDLLVDLSSVLEGPDLMHIIHNVTNGLSSVCDFYDGFLTQLKAVSKLLSTRETKRQLLQTCFSWSDVGCGFQQDVKSFKVSVHEERWNTIACAIENLHELEVALRSCWDLGKFLGQGKGHESGGQYGQSEAHGVNLTLVDEAFTSDFFWGALKVMLQIAHVQREAVRYITSCPCHYGLCRDGVDSHILSMWDRCPLRGRRCPELAAGDFFGLLQQLFDSKASMLETLLPRSLAQEEILQLLKGFMVARQHLLATYVVKLSFWNQPPHLLAGLAHHNRFTRMQCLRDCLSSLSGHPAILRLKDLEEECYCFLEAGGVWEACPQAQKLKAFAAELRLMFAEAWRVEGQHARTKKNTTVAPHHSAPYISLAHRVSELKAHLRARPESLLRLADLMDVVSHGEAAAQKLGIDANLLKRIGWSSAISNRGSLKFDAIYHDDPFCKYALALPANVQTRTINEKSLWALLKDKPGALDALALPGGAVELRRRLALSHLRSAVESNMFITMKFNPQTLYHVHSILTHRKDTSGVTDDAASVVSPAVSSDCAVDMADFLIGDGDVFCKEVVVFSVLHGHPENYRRTKVEEGASLSGLWFVQVHEIMEAKGGGEELLVALQPSFLTAPEEIEADEKPQQAPLALHIGQLPLSELMEAHVWKMRGGQIEHRFDRQLRSTVSPELLQDFCEVTRKLVKSPEGFGLGPLVAEGEIEALDILVASELVCGPPWKLTRAGHEQLRQCVWLCSPEKFLKKPAETDELGDASTFQLLLELDARGWTHEVISKEHHKRLRKQRLKYSQGDQVWHSKESDQTVCRFFLLALLQLGSSSFTEVPYGEKPKIYKVLLGIEAPEVKRPRRVQHVDDTLWLDEGDLPMGSGKRRKNRKSTAKKARRTSTDGALFSQSASANSEEGLSDGDDSNDPSSSCGGDGEHSPSKGSSSSSSSSSDSSSDSSSNSSDAETAERQDGEGGADAAAASSASLPPLPPPSEPPPPVDSGPMPHIKLKGRGFRWGPHLFTPVGNDSNNPSSWQIKCGVPGHNISQACTKRRACSFLGNLETQRVLKYWASLGPLVDTKEEHLALWDEQVLADIEAGKVPSNHDLDAQVSP